MRDWPRCVLAAALATVAATATAEACRPMPPGMHRAQVVAGRCLDGAPCRIILSPPGAASSSVRLLPQHGGVHMNLVGFHLPQRVLIAGARDGGEIALRCSMPVPDLCYGSVVSCVVDDALVAALRARSAAAPEASIVVEQPYQRRDAIPLDLPTFIEAWTTAAQGR